MRHTLIRFAAATLAGGFLLLPAAQAAPATGERLAFEAAKKGPDELRRFVNRTRMIYGLNFYDFYRWEDEAAS